MPKPRRFNQIRIRRFKLKIPKSSSSSSSEPPPPPPWVELPREITADILHRLGALEILKTAQRVCTTWWKVCQEPTMWRVIDTRNDGDVVDDRRYDLDKMCRVAVDRSLGQLIELSIEHFGNIDLLHYIAQRSSQLRHLRLVSCYSNGGLAAFAKNWPLLEELHIYLSVITKDDIKAVGRSCSRLKTFTLNDSGFRGLGSLQLQCNDQALAIAENMPELQHLALFGNMLTNIDLRAILDGCPRLQSLDLRHCYNIKLGGDIGTRCCEQIIDLKGPLDSTTGYEFNAQICDYYSEDEYPYEDDVLDYTHTYDSTRTSDYTYTCILMTMIIIMTMILIMNKMTSLTHLAASILTRTVSSIKIIFNLKSVDGSWLQG